MNGADKVPKTHTETYEERPVDEAIGPPLGQEGPEIEIISLNARANNVKNFAKNIFKICEENFRRFT